MKTAKSENGATSLGQRVAGSKKYLVIVGAVIIVVVVGGLIVRYARQAKPAEQLSEQNKFKQQVLEQLPDLQKRVEADPNNMALQQQLGVTKYATGDLQGAKDAYEKASQLDKNNAVVHNNLGNTYRDLGDYTKAETEYRLAMTLNPKLTTPYMNLGSIYQYVLGKLDTALQIYADGIKNNPDYVDFYNITAGIYEQQGLKDKAVAEFNKALEVQPGNPSALAGLKRLTGK